MAGLGTTRSVAMNAEVGFAHLAPARCPPGGTDAGEGRTMPAFTTQLTSQTTAGNEDLTAQPGWKAQMGPQPPDQGPRPDQKRPRPRQIGRKIDGRKMSREANAMDHFSAINLSALQNQPCPSERVAPGLCHQPGLIQQPHHRGATAHKAHLTAILAHPARPDERPGSRGRRA
jgi:hypothetical protein